MCVCVFSGCVHANEGAHNGQWHLKCLDLELQVVVIAMGSGN